jgi:hypothetical protein
VATPTDASVKAVVGASAAVGVVFKSSSGSVSNVQVSNLSQLPAGWSANSGAFACPSATSSNGCMLNLKYQPMAISSGNLPLSYAYTDNVGVAQTGSVTIQYAATTNNNAVASVSTTGQIQVMAGSGTQSVAVTFTTDDGNPATSLQVTSGLSSLPAGWTSASGGAFSCASFATGNGCALGLTYAPQVTGVGTLAIGFSYVDNAGATKTGNANIQYLASGDNNVVASTSPSGQIVGAVDSGTQAVTVTFVTDNTQSATNFQVTTDLTTLPDGWSGSASGLSCASVSTGSSCSMQLSYAPTGPVSGSLSVAYSFTSNTGTLKTPTMTIPYASTPGHVYIADFGQPRATPASPGVQVLACQANASSGALSNCQVAWTVTDPRSVTFHGGYAYVTSYTSNTDPSNPGGNTLYVCPVLSSGLFGSCTSTGFTQGVSYPTDVEFYGNFMYIAQNSGSLIQSCAIDSNGLPISCATNTAGGSFDTPTTIRFIGNTAFVADQWWSENINGVVTRYGAIIVCSADPTSGALSGCAQSTQFTSPNPVSLDVVGGTLFIGSDFGTWSCQASTSGLGACTQTNPQIGSLPTAGTTTSDYGIATINGFFYVGDHANNQVWICPAATGGMIGSNCTASGITLNSPTAITLF